MYSHVEVVFITGYEEDWGSGKRKRKLKGARRRKRSKHFLISPLPSPLKLLFYSFSRPCFLRFIDGYMNLRLTANFPTTVFFNFRQRNFSCFFFLNLHSMVIYSLSAMLLAILCKNILWYENRKNEKRKGSKNERKEKNDCHSHFL